MAVYGTVQEDGCQIGSIWHCSRAWLSDWQCTALFRRMAVRLAVQEDDLAVQCRPKRELFWQRTTLSGKETSHRHSICGRVHMCAYLDAHVGLGDLTLTCDPTLMKPASALSALSMVLTLGRSPHLRRWQFIPRLPHLPHLLNPHICHTCCCDVLSLCEEHMCSSADASVQRARARM